MLSSHFSVAVLYFLSIIVDGASVTAHCVSKFRLALCKASAVSGPMPKSGAIMRPSRALLMDSKWLDKILNGSKTWEVRGDNTKIRETIGALSAGPQTVLSNLFYYSTAVVQWYTALPDVFFFWKSEIFTCSAY